MKAPSTLSIPLALNYVIFCFTFFPFVWLVMTCVISPISSKLRLSRVLDADGEVLMDLGVFGGCAARLRELAGVPARGLNECTRQSPGYSVMVVLPLVDPNSPTNLQYSTTWIAKGDDTWPLVLVPIATGFVGWSAVSLLGAWWGGGRRWARLLDATNMGFHWACTIITWIAFGFSIRFTKIARNGVRAYNDNESAVLVTPLEVRYGNAVWLTLVSALLLLIGSVLNTVKALWGPAQTEPTYIPRNRDLDMEGKRSPKQQSYVGMIGG